MALANLDGEYARVRGTAQVLADLPAGMPASTPD